MKFKGSWLLSALPFLLNIVADIIGENQTKKDIEEMVDEKVERALRDHGYEKRETQSSRNN